MKFTKKTYKVAINRATARAHILWDAEQFDKVAWIKAVLFVFRLQRRRANRYGI